MLLLEYFIERTVLRCVLGNLQRRFYDYNFHGFKDSEFLKMPCGSDKHCSLLLGVTNCFWEIFTVRKVVTQYTSSILCI